MKVAIILSGCGVYDCTEIHESVLTSLALARAGAQIDYLAPDMPQARVVNHLDGSVMAGEQRNVLIEAARIARGNIKNIAQANAQDYQAIFFPGGFGAATNLSNFASQGAACTVQADVLKFAQEAAQHHIPACYICIAPALIPIIYGAGTQLTIGNDADTAAQIQTPHLPSARMRGRPNPQSRQHPRLYAGRKHRASSRGDRAGGTSDLGFGHEMRIRRGAQRHLAHPTKLR